jgi:hypothetical protein
MADQIVLAWTVDVTNSSFGPAAAAAALLAVPLYSNATTDPVLGQMFGLTVASDVSSLPGGAIAKRTLTLNMNAVHTPTAPPPFPCHPRTSTPPVLPYPLRSTKTLPGSFFVSTGSLNVATTETQVPSLAIGDSIQFLSQVGVFYVVASVSATVVGLTGAFTGRSTNTGAFKEIADPVSIAAVYSTSDLDTNGVATVPAIPASAGARTLAITYTDSTGATGRAATATLTGRRPAAIAFTNGNGIISAIENIVIASSGGFGNNVGEITLVSLSSALPALPTGLPLGTGIGAAETTVGKVGAPIPRTFKTMTDEAQLLIDRHLAYLPPSYFTLAQQGASAPQLAGDFSLTTGSKNVPTSEDQTGVLAAGNTVQFAAQFGTVYTVSNVTPKILTLTEVYSGIDDNFTGPKNVGTNSNDGTMGNVGTSVISKLSGAFRVTSVTGAPPTNAQLSGPLGQFLETQTAAPPPVPHTVDPATVPVPTFLSGFFTRQLQLAIAGVPVVPQAITFV